MWLNNIRDNTKMDPDMLLQATNNRIKGSRLVHSAANPRNKDDSKQDEKRILTDETLPSVHWQARMTEHNGRHPRSRRH